MHFSGSATWFSIYRIIIPSIDILHRFKDLVFYSSRTIVLGFLFLRFSDLGFKFLVIAGLPQVQRPGILNSLSLLDFLRFCNLGF
jgi:hypothetical protein